MSFEKWMQRVDVVMVRMCGLTHNDIADQSWYDWFEAGYKPVQAATEALENEGFPVEG